MPEFDDHTRRQQRDDSIYSVNWLPDKQARNAELDEEMFQLELDFLSGKKQHPQECRGCKKKEPSDCHYCEKRTFTILWDTIPKGEVHGRNANTAVNAGREEKKECERTSKEASQGYGREPQVSLC